MSIATFNNLHDAQTAMERLNVTFASIRFNRGRHLYTRGTGWRYYT